MQPILLALHDYNLDPQEKAALERQVCLAMSRKARIDPERLSLDIQEASARIDMGGPGYVRMDRGDLTLDGKDVPRAIFLVCRSVGREGHIPVNPAHLGAKTFDAETLKSRATPAVVEHPHGNCNFGKTP